MKLSSRSRSRSQSGRSAGYLGPNDAGKSTTVRILTGVMPATSGEASVAGFDVKEQSLEVKKRIGYVPESGAVYRPNVRRMDRLSRAIEPRPVAQSLIR